MKQLEFFKHLANKLTARHFPKSHYIKFNGDCEWMQNANSETSARKVYYRHVK